MNTSAITNLAVQTAQDISSRSHDLNAVSGLIRNYIGRWQSDQERNTAASELISNLQTYYPNRIIPPNIVTLLGENGIAITPPNSPPPPVPPQSTGHKPAPYNQYAQQTPVSGGTSGQIELRTDWIGNVRTEIGKVIVGQRGMIESLLIGLLADGHILLEGVPGLAKTTAVKALASTINASFHRIQFTPDMLPADIIGTPIYNHTKGSFEIKKGPIFANIILADEINRASAKVQSALLEAMQERQVTIGDTTYPLPEPFLVLATQNPIEQEGTYPLPEAQIDRFMFKVLITYPSKDDEREILRRGDTSRATTVMPVVEPAEITEMRRGIEQIFISPKLEEYILDIVAATRKLEGFQSSSSTEVHPANIDIVPKKTPLKKFGAMISIGGSDDSEVTTRKIQKQKELIRYGASPRAVIYLARSARARAFLSGRNYVTPEDIKKIGYEVLRHRIIVSFEAEADEITSDRIIRDIFDNIEVP
ncbi:MAG: MoxR family ATPase [Candidatus Electryoneaceae bacterium]|nr:MoxR family ATPase [Candidatus Electryoneaceae bacterium]